MEVILADGTELKAQEVEEKVDTLILKFINQDRDKLVEDFQKEEKTKRIIKKDEAEVTTFEKFIEFVSFTEKTGGIMEIRLIQKGKSLEEKVDDALKQLTDVQVALAEFFETVGGMM